MAGKLTPRACGICGKVFEPRNGRQKYCSEECSKKADLKHMHEARERKLHKHSDSINARIEADRRLSRLAGTHPGDYVKRQKTALIEEFARVRVEPEEEDDMAEEFNPGEIVRRAKAGRSEMAIAESEVLKRENLQLRADNEGLGEKIKDLREHNEELVAQLAKYERRKAMFDDVAALLKVATRLVEEQDD